MLPPEMERLPGDGDLSEPSGPDADPMRKTVTQAFMPVRSITSPEALEAREDAWVIDEEIVCNR